MDARDDLSDTLFMEQPVRASARRPPASALRRVNTDASAFRPPDVHVEVYRSVRNEGWTWVPLCKPEQRFQARVLDPADASVVTCRLCLRSGRVPAAWRPAA